MGAGLCDPEQSMRGFILSKHFVGALLSAKGHLRRARWAAWNGRDGPSPGCIEFLNVHDYV